MELLKVKDVNFTYDQNKYVLKDIDMSFQPGKVYGIFGKSGAGKTTLLSLIAGLEVLKEGDILYQGKSIKTKNRDHYRSHEIGVIFQSYNLLPHLTAIENVLLSMDISGVKEKNKKEQAYQLLNKVGIDTEKANRKVLQLSGGEQQRISIARALSYQANLILADEPTGNLDKDTEEEIIDLLLRLAHEDKKCVIIVSHSPRVREKVDQLYYLINGKIDYHKSVI